MYTTTTTKLPASVRPGGAIEVEGHSRLVVGFLALDEVIRVLGALENWGRKSAKSTVTVIGPIPAGYSCTVYINWGRHRVENGQATDAGEVVEEHEEVGQKFCFSDMASGVCLH